MRRAKQPDRFIARPAAKSWELWRFAEGNSPERIQTGDSCSDLNIPPEALILLSSSVVLTSLAWAPKVERKEMREAVFLQIELLGLAPTPPVSWDFQIVREEESRFLVSIWILPTLPPQLADLDIFFQCTPAAFGLNLADHSCTLWKESGRWTCAVKSEGKIFAVQSLGENEIDQGLRSEVDSLTLQLEIEQALPSMASQPLILLFEEDEAQPPLAMPSFSRSEALPSPSWPDEYPRLRPEIFESRQKRREQGKLARRGAVVAFALLLTALLVILGHTALLWFRYQRLTQQLESVEPRVQNIRSAAEKWNTLSQAVDPQQSALEILYRTARHLDPEFIRFTLFELKNGNILLVGEGNDISSVVDLQTKLANDLELSEYHWKLPPPTILPNNVARFEISGDRPEYVKDE